MKNQLNENQDLKPLTPAQRTQRVKEWAKIYKKEAMHLTSNKVLEKFLLMIYDEAYLEGLFSGMTREKKRGKACAFGHE